MHVQGPAQVETGTDGGFLYSLLGTGQGLMWGGLAAGKPYAVSDGLSASSRRSRTAQPSQTLEPVS